MFPTVLVLVLLNGFFLAGSLYWLDGRRLRFLAMWKPWSWLHTWPGGVALTITLLDIAGFTVRMLNEWWTLPAWLSKAARIMESDSLQALAFLASLGLLLPMVMEILRRQLPRMDDHLGRATQETARALYAVFFLGLVLIVEGAKAAFTAAGNPATGVITPVGLMFVAILVPLYATSRVVQRLKDLPDGPHRPFERIRSANVFALLIGAVFLRSILTWAGALLVLPRLTRETAHKLLVRLLRRTARVPPLRRQDSLQLLASRMAQTTPWRSIAFHTLVAAAYPMIFIIHVGEGPLGTAEAAYQWTATLTALYTAAAVLLLLALTRLHEHPAWLMATSTVWLAVLYVIPLAQPDTFAPAPGAIGFQAPLHVMVVWNGNLLWAILVLAGIHLVAMGTAIAQDHARLAMWDHVLRRKSDAARRAFRAASWHQFFDKSFAGIFMVGFWLLVIGPTWDERLRASLGDELYAIGDNSLVLRTATVIAAIIVLAGYYAFWSHERRRDARLRRAEGSLFTELRSIAHKHGAQSIDDLQEKEPRWRTHGTGQENASEWRTRRRIINAWTTVALIGFTVLWSLAARGV